MITDRTLLKIFLDRAVYDKYSQYIKYNALQEETKTILLDIGLYFEEFPNVQVIDLDIFKTFFQQIRHPDLTESKTEIYNYIFDKIRQETTDVGDEFYQKVLQYFKDQEYKDKITRSFEDGLDVSYLKEIIQDYESDSVEDDEYVSNDFSTIFEEDLREEGLQWRLKCLQKSIGNLIQGDFGCVAGYVETGKTSFMCSEVSFMAQQIKEGKVLWFNNEGPEKKIQQRLWAATLNASIEDVKKYPDRAQEKFTEKMNGDKDRVLFFPAYKLKPQQIESKVKKYNAKLVIIDMLDGLHLGNEVREDIKLERLYQAMRRISVNYCPIIGTTQCDSSTTWISRETGEVGFKKYIEMHQLHGSKVGKQGALEFLITIGKDPNYPNSRYIHVPKNKLSGDGNPANKYIKAEVTFDERKSLYID